MSEQKKMVNCKQLERLPVVNEWQEVYCPACGHYCQGKCVNPNRESAESPCPFDGKPLPAIKVVD